MSSGSSEMPEGGPVPFDGDGNVHSQFGEDRILADLLALLPDRNGWCVEFGAWDGRHFSNTLQLVESAGYNGVMIEADADRFADLELLTQRLPNIRPVHRMVGWEGPDRLDAVLAELPVPYDFDVLSIDIDGNDYHVWYALIDYRPKIVVIEFNPTIPTEASYIQPADPAVMHGTGIASLVALGHEKGYELAAATLCNAVFVDERYFDLLELADNSAHVLRADLRAMTWMFTAADGSMHLIGARWLPWHDTPMVGMEGAQVPWLLRVYPERMGFARRTLYRMWRARRRART